MPDEIHREDQLILHATVPIPQGGAPAHEPRITYGQEQAIRRQRRAHFFGFLLNLLFLCAVLLLIAHLRGWIELSWPG